MRRFDFENAGQREILPDQSGMNHNRFVVRGEAADLYPPLAKRLPTFTQWDTPDHGPVGGRVKRAVDIVVAVAAIVIAAPLLVAIAVAVKINMGGEVFYRHRRVGFRGQTFDCLKYRTMVANADEVLARHLAENPQAAEEWRRNRKLSRDPRITRLGRLLRKTSLDELPQLINILRGDMSCVGPRPVVSDELNYYGAFVPDYLSARPGITGAWQVSGRSSVGYERRIELDTAYVRGWSLARDIEILARTVPAVLRVSQAT